MCLTSVVYTVRCPTYDAIDALSPDKLVPTTLSQAMLAGLVAYFLGVLWLHLTALDTHRTAEPMVGLALLFVVGSLLA